MGRQLSLFSGERTRDDINTRLVYLEYDLKRAKRDVSQLERQLKIARGKVQSYTSEMAVLEEELKCLKP